MFSNSLLDKKKISVQYTTPTSFGQLTTVYRRNLHIHPTPNQLNIKPPFYRAEYITLQVMALLSTTIRRSNALLRLVLTHPKQRCDAAAVARVGVRALHATSAVSADALDMVDTFSRRHGEFDIV